MDCELLDQDNLHYYKICNRQTIFNTACQWFDGDAFQVSYLLMALFLGGLPYSLDLFSNTSF